MPLVFFVPSLHQTRRMREKATIGSTQLLPTLSLRTTHSSKSCTQPPALIPTAPSRVCYLTSPRPSIRQSPTSTTPLSGTLAGTLSRAVFLLSSLLTSAPSFCRAPTHPLVRSSSAPLTGNSPSHTLTGSNPTPPHVGRSPIPLTVSSPLLLLNVVQPLLSSIIIARPIIIAVEC